MSCWRLVFTVLLLLALPLKGLAAVGAVGCASAPLPVTAAAVPPVPALSGHPADAPCEHHAPEAASTPDTPADAAPSDDHGPCHHSAPCCVALALGAVPHWQLGELPAHGAPASRASRPVSVTPPTLERPPRA